jgi:hypothetical protein
LDLRTTRRVCRTLLIRFLARELSFTDCDFDFDKRFKEREETVAAAALMASNPVNSTTWIRTARFFRNMDV